VQGKRRVQCDEIWDFVYAKETNVPYVVPWDTAGTVWMWTALDTESRLLLAYHCTKRRDARSATKLMRDLKPRLDRMPDISTDMLDSYRIATRKVFGRRCRLVQGKENGNTAHVERHNLTIRTRNRRYVRKGTGFSKTFRDHMAMAHLSFVYYNFCCIHRTLRVSPAMAAGIDDTLRDIDWIVGLIEKNTPKPKKPGPKPGSRNRRRQGKA